MANHADHNALAKISFQSFWRSHLAVVLPRLFLSAFSFAQPFVLQATVHSISEENSQDDGRYWLVAATALAYVGIGVSI